MGAVAFTVVTLVVLAVATLAVVHVSWTMRPNGRLVRLGALGVLAGLFVYLTVRFDSPEEALHFVEYGVLAVLVLRAVTARTRDQSAYLAAAAVCLLVGSADEVVQWLVPSRFFAFRDIGLNALASIGTLLGVRFGIDPAYLHGWSTAGLQRAVTLWLGACVCALALFANTPPVVHAYTSVLTPLRYLRSDGPMVEYGTAHTASGVSWHSRFDSDAAHALDEAGANDLARIQADVAADPGGGDPGLTRGGDPFEFEVVAHTRVLSEAREALETSRNASAGASLARTVLGEDVILREMYPRVTALSGVGLSEQEREAYAGIATADPYVSPVDGDVITSPVQKLLVRLLIPFTLALLAVEILRRVRRTRAAPRQRATSISSTT